MRIYKKILLLPLLLPLASCSVYMAANKQGTSVEKLNSCRTRSCIIAHGAKPTFTKKNANGMIIEETYHIMKPKGSYARAVMHGALDLSTCGLWELAGTPIEYSLDKTKRYAVKVHYQNGEEIKSIELG
jgi:hypothetical protein